MMNVTFKVAETPRVYVERIDITGNTITRDKVIRREFRLNEGDAFNALKVKRSQDRIQSLGFSRTSWRSSRPRARRPTASCLASNVEEKPTGQLSLSAGYSSLERFVVQLSVAQSNFMGKGQQATRRRQLVALLEVGRGRIHRAVFPRQADPARRQAFPPRLQQLQFHRRSAQHDLFAGQHRRRAPHRLPDHRILDLRRPLHLAADKISLDKTTFYTDPTARTDPRCDPLKAGAYLCDEVGTRTDLVCRLFDWSMTTPTASTRRAARTRLFSARISRALGGDVRYFRAQVDATKY